MNTDVCRCNHIRAEHPLDGNYKRPCMKCACAQFTVGACQQPLPRAPMPKRSGVKGAFDEILVDDVVMTRDHYTKLMRAGEQLSKAVHDLLSSYSADGYANLEEAVLHYETVAEESEL